jgi:hypothetical protein
VAAEPITIFSYKIEPAGVLDLLRKLAPNLKVVGADADWQQATILGRRRLLAKRSVLTFRHDSGYYAGSNWLTQVRGMQNYFAQFPENENSQRILLLIQSFRFALAVAPDPPLDLEGDDERLAIVYAVVKHLDGAIFTPTSLRDASGKILSHVQRDPDPDAVMPAIFKELSAAPRSERMVSEGGSIPDEEMTPPAPQRVARRACALATVAARALLEQEDYADPGVEDTRQRILQWVEQIGVHDELEPDEWKVLQRPLGKLVERDALNGTWRLEGLAILAWALKLFDLPPHDRPVDPGKLLPSVGILDAEKATAILAEPQLRSRQEFESLSQRLFAIHWRLRNYQLKPERMNFRQFARTAWFGPLDIAGLPLKDEDLALGDKAIADAPVSLLQNVMSAAMERHLAINWLNGYAEIYSETDVST